MFVLRIHNSTYYPTLVKKAEWIKRRGYFKINRVCERELRENRQGGLIHKESYIVYYIFFIRTSSFLIHFSRKKNQKKYCATDGLEELNFF